ncbi:MAG: radical SAM protein [Candidatus Omnitrophota bacterium]
MKDVFSINGHKLIYHIPAINRWLEGKKVYPVYAEVGLSGGCNHRCVFCAFDYLKYGPEMLPLQYLKKFIKTAAANGVKSVLFSGEGEPLLHKNICEIINFTKRKGIDTALSTNGVLLNRDIAKRILPDLSWLRFSINAGTKKTYAFIHGTSKEDFDVVMKNLAQAVRIKAKNKYKCALGAQMLLLAQNIKEAKTIATKVKNSGADYLVVKPYCPHPLSSKKAAAAAGRRDLSRLGRELQKICGGGFNVVVRASLFEPSPVKKTYDRCLGFDFAAHVSADGSVYPCNAFAGQKDFAYGNICRQPFEKIWGGRRRKEVIDRIYGGLDVNNCRNSCRLDKINKYLWELKNSVAHVNFI